METFAPPIVSCRSCGAKIFWCITARGKRIPINAEPDNAKGNLIVTDRGEVPGERFLATIVQPLLDASQTRYLSHFATCPQAKKWSR